MFSGSAKKRFFGSRSSLIFPHAQLLEAQTVESSKISWMEKLQGISCSYNVHTLYTIQGRPAFHIKLFHKYSRVGQNGTYIVLIFKDLSFSSGSQYVKVTFAIEIMFENFLE